MTATRNNPLIRWAGSFLTKLKRNRFSVSLFICLFILGAAGIGFIQFRQAYELLENQRASIAETMQSSLQQANAFIDTDADAVKNLLQSLSLREDLFDFSDLAETEKRLLSVQKSNELVQSIYVSDKSGSMCSSSQMLYSVVQDTHVTEHMEQSRANPNVIQYSEPYYTSMFAGYAVCAALSFNNGERTVAVELATESLYAGIRPILDIHNNEFILASSNGNVIFFDRGDTPIPMQHGQYPLRAHEIFEELVSRDYSQMEILEDASFPEYKLMYSSNNKLGWRVFIFCPTAVFEESYHTLASGFITTCLAWVVLLAAVMFIVTYFFTRPIRRLAETMDQVNDFDDLIPVDLHREDEIGRLSRNYNRLIAKIKLLLEDVRQAERTKSQYELHMLQSQIGPHFLYNTLACVVSLIRQNQPELAHKSVSALIELLSYSFERTQSSVTLEDELREIGNYVAIELMRYGEVFTFKTQISPDAAGCPMLKLTLQPLVENAIFHGVIPRGDDCGKILIAAHKLHGDMVVLVCDNGVGIPKEKCGDILSGEGVPRIRDRLSSIGVSNVHDRLRLTYGERYGIRIRSRVGVGTVMRLIIPLTNVKSETS